MINNGHDDGDGPTPDQAEIEQALSQHRRSVGRELTRLLPEGRRMGMLQHMMPWPEYDSPLYGCLRRDYHDPDTATCCWHVVRIADSLQWLLEHGHDLGDVNERLRHPNGFEIQAATGSAENAVDG